MPYFTSVDDALLVLNHPEAPGWGEALRYLLRHGPEPLRQRLQSHIDEALEAVGLEFNRAGYLEDGEAVTTLSEVAARLGLTEAEVEARVQELEARDGTRYLHRGGEVHRAH